MAKAKREMIEKVRLVDIVIKIMDARIPMSSNNPEFDKIFDGKANILIINKADLADKNANDTWIDFFKNTNTQATILDSTNNGQVNRVKNWIIDICKKRQQEIKKQKGINKPIRAMVVGIPNVGKSTFINSLSGSQKAKVGNKPGVTRGQQWIRINNFLEMLDTPGLLWPKLDNQTTALHLAFAGCIKKEIVDNEELAVKFIEELKHMYPQMLMKRYNLDKLEGHGYQILEQICLNKGLIKSRGISDINRGADMLIKDFQSGKMGKITLEFPYMIGENK
jgi:ribosome biogenesis GTPase A